MDPYYRGLSGGREQSRDQGYAQHGSRQRYGSQPEQGYVGSGGAREPRHVLQATRRDQGQGSNPTRGRGNPIRHPPVNNAMPHNWSYEGPERPPGHGGGHQAARHSNYPTQRDSRDPNFEYPGVGRGRRRIGVDPVNDNYAVVRPRYATTNDAQGMIRPPPGMYPPELISSPPPPPLPPSPPPPPAPPASGLSFRDNYLGSLLPPESQLHPILQSRRTLPQLARVTKPVNDCEVIVIGNAQRDYAEKIENHIKSMGLRTDMIFPTAPLKVSKFAEDLAILGVLFAVFVRADNEAHCSVSIHVLKGPPKPEEHRNMPLQAAYDLIKDRFAELKRSELDVIPENIKKSLELINNCRFLTDTEYQQLIKYLQDRWQAQRYVEKRDEFDMGTNILTREELRLKILDLLGAKNPAEMQRPRLKNTSQTENSQSQPQHHPFKDYGHGTQASTSGSTIRGPANPGFY